ncbi:acyl-CoA dehydrogenase family protein [Cryobacterium sp. PH29-G1]|uniref:acyl-CoA dehydrogenase family protein n=1 Tax=Cryobacterium sp. PH29-G1 TaxID=3046211 RepID=UPI0024BBAC62|nr:acyl-CoA dehydrogenase family protein [Cryobacterium sp. PH29-G1]MDJ0349515.1 acyl-CoA dehydrogenase [Cryobacterium sp. PH29-G1]
MKLESNLRNADPLRDRNDLAAAAGAVNGDARRAVALTSRLAFVPRPGEGRTTQLFDTLSTLAAADLTAARVAEAHLDALAILEQAGDGARPDQTWGVFAAESSGTALTATRVSGGGWRLNGTKPWCSLAGLLSHALVTAHVTPSDGEARRRLFAVDLRQIGISVHDESWVARGLAQVASGPVDFSNVVADPIGGDGWYLQRSGFAWGGIGVAAVWWGGAVGMARTLYASTQDRTPDQIALAHLGAVDVAISASQASLATAATAIDAGEADGPAGSLLAARVRGIVARTVDEVIFHIGHALGPAPLALDARHAQRVADLQLYVRQHHAERDDAALGRILTTRGSAPW